MTTQTTVPIDAIKDRQVAAALDAVGVTLETYVGSGVTLGAGVATFLATPTSANLATAVTNETGSGLLVFATSPTLTTPLLGTPTSGNLSNCTGGPTLTSATLVTPAIGEATGTGVTLTGYLKESVGNALTAAGVSRADALQLAKQINNVTTAAAGTGVILPVGVAGMIIVVFNAGANALQVYASASETIDTVAGSTGVPLTNTKRAMFMFVAANTWISAQLGVVSA